MAYIINVSFQPAEFLKQINPSFIFGTLHNHFLGYQDEKLVSHQYRAWSDCMDVQAGLALCWWQRLITFDCSRIRVNIQESDEVYLVHAV